MRSDEDRDGDDGERTFHRISGILSNLIQEANEAVSHTETVQSRILRKTAARAALETATLTTTTSTVAASLPPHPVRLRPSRIPRPRLDPSSSSTIHHARADSRSSFRSSSSSLASEIQEPFSPAMSETTRSSVSRSPSPAKAMQHIGNRRRAYSSRPLSCPAMQLATRRSMTPRVPPLPRSSIIDHDSLLESFKRLDSSLAVVDSLSRDLVTPIDDAVGHSDGQSATMDRHFTLLFLLPLLHIPHALIATVIDSLTTPSFLRNSPFPPVTAPSEGSSGISSVVVFTCIFALASLLVDKVIIASGIQFTTAAPLRNYKRRLSLPGSYNTLAGRADTPTALPTSASLIHTTEPTDKTWGNRHRRKRPSRRSTLYRKRQVMLVHRQQHQHHGQHHCKGSSTHTTFLTTPSTQAILQRRHSF